MKYKKCSVLGSLGKFGACREGALVEWCVFLHFTVLKLVKVGKNAECCRNSTPIGVLTVRQRVKFKGKNLRRLVSGFSIWPQLNDTVWQELNKLLFPLSTTTLLHQKTAPVQRVPQGQVWSTTTMTRRIYNQRLYTRHPSRPIDREKSHRGPATSQK